MNVSNSNKHYLNEDELLMLANLAHENEDNEDPNRPVNINDFTILKVIGRGAFGKVFLCVKKTEPDIPLAMKAVRKDNILEEGMLENIKSEGHILNLVKGHPFLVGNKWNF